MATKPLITPRIWCSAGVYTTGPFIGDISRVDPGAGIAAEGYRPGANFPTAAEHANYEAFHETTWITSWVALGSFTGAADAHLVETNAAGRSQLQGLTLDDAVDETVLNVVGVNALAPAVLVNSSTGGGPAIQAIIDPDSFGFTTTVGAGTGSGVSVALQGTLAGGAGVDVSDDASGEGDGFRAVLGGDGNGVKSTVSGGGFAGYFIHNGPNAALRVDGSPTSTAMVINGNGGTTGLFVDADGTTTAALLLGGDAAGTDACTAQVGNTSGKAYVATLQNASTSASRGFYCSTSTSSAAVPAEFVANGTGADGNYAVILTGDQTAPTKGIVLMTPQNADPSGGGVAGGLAMSTAKGLTGGNFADGTWRSYWNSQDGFSIGYSLSDSVTTNGNLVWVTGTTLTIANNGDSPKVAGATLIFRLSCNVRVTTAGGTKVLGVWMQDVTNGGATVFLRNPSAGIGSTSGYPLATADTNWQPTCIVRTFSVSVPAVGIRQWTIKFSDNGGVGFIALRDISLEFLGT